MTVVVSICLVLSGATCLLYETIWFRLFSNAFGNSTQAAAVVFSAFMGGLALGGWIGSRRAFRKRRGLMVYAGMEALIGLMALALPALVPSVPNVAVACLFLLPPTVLMGWTYPVANDLLVSRKETMFPSIPVLYALNTLGAALGCFFAGFHAIRLFGLVGANRIGAGLSLVTAGLLAVLSLRRKDDGPAEGPVAAETRTYGFLVLYAVCGAAAMVYEVVWIRILEFTLPGGMGLRAFTALMTTLLAGVGMGSLAEATGCFRKARPAVVLAFLHVILGAIVWASYVDFASSGRLMGRLFWGASAWKGQFRQAALLALAPALLLGIAFPLLYRCVAGNRPGSAAGRTYAANVFGCVLGPLIAAFFLIPLIGTEGTLKAAVLSSLAVGVGFILLELKVMALRRPAAIACLASALAAAFWVLAEDRALLLRVLTPNYRKAAAFQEDPFTSVLVTRHADGMKLIVGGVAGSGTQPVFQENNRLLAEIPLRYRPEAKRVAVIAVGTGQTAGFFATHPGMESVDMVDLSPSVFDLAGTLFREANGAVMTNPKIRPVVDDGSHFIRDAPEGYDIIAADPYGPRHPGSAKLYSADFLKNCRDKLAPGGVMVLWAFREGVHQKTLKTALRTFLSVFPDANVWYTERGKSFLFLGGKGTTSATPASLKGLLWMEPEEAVAFAGDAGPLETLDRPVLEFLIDSDRSKRMTAEWMKSRMSSSVP